MIEYYNFHGELRANVRGNERTKYVWLVGWGEKTAVFTFRLREPVPLVPDDIQ